VRVALALPGADAVADGDGGGKGPSDDDPGEHVTRVAIGNRNRSDLDAKSPTVWAERLNVGDAEDRVRSVTLKYE
jgi:hypothetical protein